MAEKRFLVHLDLNGNSLMNAGFERLAVAPASPVVGQQYFDTATTQQMMWDGTAWKDVLGNIAISANANTPSLTVDTSTAGQAVLAIADATGTDSGLMSSTQNDLVNNATDAGTNSAIVKRDAAGSFTTASITITGTPTNGTDAATKAYVDGVITSGMEVKGSIDCSAQPNYPAASTGDAYYVTAAGKIGGASGETVAIGDLILCTADAVAGNEATVGGSWIVLERNLDIATDTNAGIMRLATAAEVTAGTATDAIPTVNDVTSLINNSTGNSYIANVASGNTSYTINHALAGDVIVQVYEKATGDHVSLDVSRTDSNNIVLSTNVALATTHVVMCTLIGAQP
jgi:hypothetical protein